MSAAYLDKLNPEQRRAVEHGGVEHGGSHAGPLLVIAGAVSGKTSTLAHRVAHLIVAGADPRRILLLTFSRRAAAEMTRRAERILGKAMSRNAGVMIEALNWAGTFHGIGSGGGESDFLFDVVLWTATNGSTAAYALVTITDWALFAVSTSTCWGAAVSSCSPFGSDGSSTRRGLRYDHAG